MLTWLAHADYHAQLLIYTFAYIFTYLLIYLANHSLTIVDAYNWAQTRLSRFTTQHNEAGEYLYKFYIAKN